MINLGHKYPTTLGAEPKPEAHIDYPTVYLRGDDVPTDLPEGKFCCVVEMRVAGMRNPSDGEKTVDLELLQMSKPLDKAKARKLVGGDYEDEEEEDEEESFSPERSNSSFRKAMKKVVSNSQIGQSG